ncbi:transcriptional regulator, TraR/DksA family [Chthoniobacter flavus Ellin428]|uniref:Transcriptional regulator, TraR/DksA family n=1 Tax=Chthoniobacter flavus Ellin428 TaxID=497964 RepID=B4D2T0_9BACT|nr:TraR/DksA C4-type zinc finger protein [Chthoniobacter flavus]EDY19041.1 transcriptional regulator, TraR/DksA family [Chthoniobacter flavus Ellin428]TCO86804.1 TraR/DksA family transcriptional regulator [Chthoniobacter flavus]
MADPTNETSPASAPGFGRDGTGAGAMTDRKKIDPRWRGYYDALLRERDHCIDLVSGLATTAREANPNPIQDGLADTATDLNQADESRGVLSHDQDLLVEINHALSKIEEGTYGVCELTGQPIPAERLKAVPWARFTREAQAEFEARGEASKVKLGTLGDLDEGRPPRVEDEDVPAESANEPGDRKDG